MSIDPNLSILVTGGTGSFGRKFVQTLLKGTHPRKIIVFSRDELKQHEMRAQGFTAECMRYFIGDVRDRERLRRAMNGVDIVIHAAALKHVSACEYNPIEAIQTNIIGAQNIINAAIDAGVKKVLALSTDKAVNPVNLYGASKLCAEKLFVQGNAYSGSGGTLFSCVRYGNVMGSSGSVVPLFREQRKKGAVSITDERMTRFWLTLEQGVDFVLRCLKDMHGGEIFVPKIPSARLTDLVEAVAPGCKKTITGIRAGEKLHECLLSEDEARHTVELSDMFVIEPEDESWDFAHRKGSHPQENWRYNSDTNTEWLSQQQLLKLLQESEPNAAC
ncbi:MAG: UDP-N-acetylglucosamine 4,6-dehydratase (inverting) [Candidatus Peribacteraceae bacterium]|nr:UDP-N-acetylglucosamine 4,6-dehydratase (inverting) [Candidatus Peribacteraceae bacterium]MDD5739891.1 UDP-N-acetylglucosamine 4,6-dehydratase (inverting) [Candidatus Peribacteraceae bacterium]